MPRYAQSVQDIFAARHSRTSHDDHAGDRFQEECEMLREKGEAVLTSKKPTPRLKSQEDELLRYQQYARLMSQQ